MAWIVFSTFFYKNNFLIDDWSVMTAAFIAPGFLIINTMKHYCLERFVFDTKCKVTHYKMGWLSLLLIINIGQYIMVESFNPKIPLLKDYYFESLYLMNPIVIYYFMYLWINSLITKKK